MAGCQEAFDTENSEFGWQNAQADWFGSVNKGWSMSLPHKMLLHAFLFYLS